MERHEGIIHHTVDPMRFPKIQKPYEDEAKKAFSSVELFGNIVEEMTNIVKNKK